MGSGSNVCGVVQCAVKKVSQDKIVLKTPDREEWVASVTQELNYRIRIKIDESTLGAVLKLPELVFFHVS